MFLNFSSFHNVLKSMAFVSEGVQRDLDSKHFLRHSSSSSCSLPHLINSLSMQGLAKSSQLWPMSFYLCALECSLTWCGYTVKRILTGYVIGHQDRAFNSWAYHFWMSPEWTTEPCLKLRERSSNLHFWFGVIIVGTDGDVFCCPLK